MSWAGHQYTPRVDPKEEPVAFNAVLRRSTRARRVSLRVSDKSGLEVIVPEGLPFDASDLRFLLERHRRWIERVLARQQQRAGQRSRSSRPRMLALELLGTRLRVQYEKRRTPGNIDLRVAGPGQLLLSGDVGNHQLIYQALGDHLRKLARKHLPPLLETHAARCGFSYKRVHIRLQKTRWGSCSSRGTISLNARLLFLPLTLVDYVLLHELAHTRHLDHSRAFWALLNEHLPNARELAKELRRREELRPDWFAG